MQTQSPGGNFIKPKIRWWWSAKKKKEIQRFADAVNMVITDDLDARIKRAYREGGEEEASKILFAALEEKFPTMSKN